MDGQTAKPKDQRVSLPPSIDQPGKPTTHPDKPKIHRNIISETAIIPTNPSTADSHAYNRPTPLHPAFHPKS
jgi:hypothetical protein